MDQNFFIKELFLARVLLEALRNILVAITNEADSEVVLRKVSLRILSQRVIVLDEATKSVLELFLSLVVHRDANGHFWVLFADHAA